MSLILDLSKYSTDELTSLINEATNLLAARAFCLKPESLGFP